MRRIFVFFIVTIFLCFSFITSYAAEVFYSVDDIRAQTVAPWHDVYLVKGRNIDVNVQPTVPDVQLLPVLKVKPAFWIPTANEETQWQAKDVHFELGGDAFVLEAGDVYDEERTATKGKNVESVTHFFYAPVLLNESYAEANTLTFQQMIDKMQMILTEADPDHFDVDMDHVLYVQSSGKIDKTTGQVLLPETLAVEFHTTLRSIPIWGHVFSSVDSRKNDKMSYRPLLTLVMRDEDSYRLLGKTVCETDEIVADIPLCSFEKVQNAIEAEIENGHIRAVYSVDLGYALYNEPGSSRTQGREWMKTAVFYAVPTWRCVCIYTNLAKKDIPEDVLNNPAPSMYLKTLYFDAQTGMLIDPNNDQNEQGDYKGIVLWEQVK